MSYEWQSLRPSLLGPKSGLSQSQNQQILQQMQELHQKSRRVSLNTNFRNTGLTRDSALFECSNTETNSRCQSSNDSYCATQQQTINSCNSIITSTKTQKSSKNLSEGQTQSQSQSQFNFNSVVNNSVNHSVNSSISCLNSVLSTPAMIGMPIILENVSARPSIEMSGRMSRRSSKAAQDSFMCSQQSVLSAMDRFVKAVNNMDSTVLVPSKLRDMDMPSPKLVRIPPALANTDLHSFYLMLNDVKKELLWGPGTQPNTTSIIPLSGRSSPRDLKHKRQPSDDSLGSTASSSSDQDTDSEADSLMTDRDSIDEHTSHLANAFRHHLQGLHTILHELADSADYLCSRYQEDIDASL